LLARAIPERLRGEFLTIKRYTNLRLLYFTTTALSYCLTNLLFQSVVLLAVSFVVSHVFLLAMLPVIIRCRDLLLKTAKDLVDNAKALVAGAASNQEHLMTAANTVTETIARMANCVKLGAASLGSHQPDAQVTLSVIVLPVLSAGDRCISLTCAECPLRAPGP